MPKKLENCVKAVKKQGGKYNPWAICVSSIYGKKKKKSKKKTRKKKKK